MAPCRTSISPPRRCRSSPSRFVDLCREHTGTPFPADPYAQLELAIEAVFRSWMGKRAVDYRRQFRITKDMANGTAVNVCTMVFGNMGDDSATGVGFTRNPGTGENAIYGEYLVNAQGEDVVAGIRTPKPIAAMAAGDAGSASAARRAARPARGALPRSAGLRVHHRARPPLLPADAQRQDERAGDGRHVGGDVRRGTDHAGAGAEPHQSDAARATARAATRPDARRAAAGAGAAGIAGRRVRPASCSTRTPPKSAASTATRSCSCARRPSPRTSTASSRRRRS